MKTIRNIFGFLIAVYAGFFLGSSLLQMYGIERLGEVFKFSGTVYFLFVTLSMQMIKNLSDLGQHGGLGDRERERLTHMVSEKTRRLWAFIVLCILSTIAGLASYLTAKDPDWGYTVALIACMSCVLSLYFFIYIPIMFHEVTKFRDEVYRRSEEYRRKTKLLDEMTRESEQEFVRDPHLDGYNEIVKHG